MMPTITRRLGAACCVLLAVAAPACVAGADDAALRELLRANSHSVELVDGALVGPGAELLWREFASAQFVAVGEDHNRRNIPKITAAIFAELNARHGFQYFATEQDPVTMRAISEAPLRGDLEAIGRAARQEPYSFTFITDEELDMLASIGRRSTARRPIWGCEQAFGATHILRRLVDLAPDEAVAGQVRELLARASESERVRDTRTSQHFLARTDLRDDLRQLKNGFAGATGEVAFMLRALALSAEIYQYFHAGNRGEVPGHWSNSKVREEYMKEVCRDEYLSAMRDGQQPKVLLKHGPWHLYEVSSPAHITTLGTFFSQLAVLNGTGYRSLMLSPTRFDGTDAWESGEHGAWRRPFVPVIDHDRWVVVDLRPFREYPNLLRLREGLGTDSVAVRNWLNRTVYGFDFVMFIGDGVEGSYALSGIDAAQSP